MGELGRVHSGLLGSVPGRAGLALDTALLFSLTGTASEVSRTAGFRRVLAIGQPGEDRMAFTHSDSIAVKRIKGKGRGVFARRLITKGEVIEKVPMIVMSAKEYEEELSGSRLSNYCFAWGRNQVALALGYGSIYNHSYKPNARYEDVGPQTKVFLALRVIESGEEITVNYNGKPQSRSAVWFKVIEPSTAAQRRVRPDVNGKS
jgi:hypothetical protein